MPTAGAIMDQAAAILNDASKELYTYTAQLPYIRSALRQYLIRLQDNGVPVLKEISATIDVAADATTITLPSSFILPIWVKERQDGTTDLFEDVDEVDDIPEMEQVDSILYWNWREEAITINPPRTAREVQLKYWKTLAEIVDQNTSITLLNCQEPLAFRTAALCARYIGENPSRAIELELVAKGIEDIVIGIEVKAKQSNPVRRKPYSV